MATPSAAPTKLALEPNVPQQIALKYSTGKIVDSQFGDGQQVFFSLVDGRHAYLPLGVGQSINNLQLGTREPFFICKRWNGSKTQKPRYDVWLTPQGEKDRAEMDEEPPFSAPPDPPEEPSVMERQLAASIARVQEQRQQRQEEAARKPPAAAAASQQSPTQGTGTNGPVAVPQRAAAPAVTGEQRPRTRLEDALKTAVAAAYAATEYAKEIGYAAMPMFTAEDIRTMANTLIIDGQRNGGGR